MRYNRKVMLPLVLGVVLVVCSPASGWEDPPICAVIELDVTGRLWVNGSAGDLNIPVVHACEEASMIIVAPDYSAPASAFVGVMTDLRNSTQIIKVLMPSLRREMNDIYGMDMLLRCQKYAEHEIQPVPSESAAKEHGAIKILDKHHGDEGNAGATKLEMPGSSIIGIADDVAASLDAYEQLGGVAFVVISEGIRAELKLEESDHWLPPPPRIETKLIDGVKRRGLVDERQLCIYPESTNE